MNWYKKAQIEKQEDFPFFKDIPKQKAMPIEQTDQYQKLMEKTPDILQDLLDNCKDFEEAIKILKLYKFDFKVIKDIAVVYLNKKTYIIDDMLEMRDPYKWIWSIGDWELDNYVEYPDFNKEFWDYPSPVYHATSPENWEIIKEEGLAQKDMIRGIENRSTGSAVFTSDNPDDIANYGSVTIEINTPLMKSDGYTPLVAKEEPITRSEKIEALANLIGLQDFFAEVESGISPSTIVFFDHIPPKYLRAL
jgi:hypothetical protein